MIRFYKGIGNDGTHVGSLWSPTGELLASVTFVDEPESGWQTAILAIPVALTPGELYVVSYLAPQGHYASTPGYFANPRASGPLTAVATNNGRFLYGAAGGFPTESNNATNYFVDVAFTSAG